MQKIHRLPPTPYILLKKREKLKYIQEGGPNQNPQKKSKKNKHNIREPIIKQTETVPKKVLRQLRR